tara:strand:- start:5241 stop:6596 length:1356 start_codon:yes stop_codon:yes gene_type:complete
MRSFLLGFFVCLGQVGLSAHTQMPPTKTVCLDANPDATQKRLVTALVDLHKPSLAASDFTQSPAADLSRIAKLLECPKSDKTCDQRKKLADAVSQLIVDRKNGFYTLDWSAKASGSEPLTIEARFEAFFKTSEPTYSVTCTGRTPESDWPPIKLPSLVVASTPSDLSKPAVKRSDATLSITIDRENRIGLKDDDGMPLLGDDGKQVFVENEDFKFKGVVAANPVSLRSEKDENSKERVFLSVRPFVSLNYDNNVTPSDEVDDFGFGAQFKWDLDGWSEYFFLTPQWITDIEQRESSQFVIEARSTLPLYNVLGKKSMDALGYANDKLITANPEVKFFWTLDAVADFGDIQDAGDKTELETIERYTRVGYDLNAQLSLQGNDTSGLWTLSGQYKFRDDLDRGLAKMDLIDITASYKPPGKSNFSFEISYDRGENLTSLKPIETWTFGLGFHN